MKNLNKKEALNFLNKIIENNFEVYGVDLYKKNDFVESLYCMKNYNDTKTFYNSNQNYENVKKFIETMGDNQLAIFFFDKPYPGIEFKVKIVTKLYDKVNAYKMIERLYNEDRLFFGFDGFVITDTYTQPFQEFSPDFSSENSWEVMLKVSKEVIDRAPDEMLFELVYDKSDLESLLLKETKLTRED